MFIDTRPLHHDWPTRNRPRDQSRIQGNVVRAIMTVASCAFGMSDAYRLNVYIQHLRQSIAQYKGRLRMRPDRKPIILPIR